VRDLRTHETSKLIQKPCEKEPLLSWLSLRFTLIGARRSIKGG